MIAKRNLIRRDILLVHMRTDFSFPPLLFSSPQDGDTAIMYAVQVIEDIDEDISIESREKVVQLLIDGGANVNAQNQVLWKYCRVKLHFFLISATFIFTPPWSILPNTAFTRHIKPCLARYGTARLKSPCELAQIRTVPYHAGTVIATVLHGTVRRGSITFAPCERITALSMHIIIWNVLLRPFRW